MGIISYINYGFYLSSIPFGIFVLLNFGKVFKTSKEIKYYLNCLIKIRLVGIILIFFVAARGQHLKNLTD